MARVTGLRVFARIVDESTIGRLDAFADAPTIKAFLDELHALVQKVQAEADLIQRMKDLVRHLAQCLQYADADKFARLLAVARRAEAIQQRLSNPAAERPDTLTIEVGVDPPRPAALPAAVSARARYLDRKAHGRCTRCPTKNAIPGETRCAACKAKVQSSRKKSRAQPKTTAKTKAMSVNGQLH